MSTERSITFSGSYAPEDVTFLLRPVSVPVLPVAEKERRLLSGSSHYAEMLSEEQLPDARWLLTLEEARLRRRARVARDHLHLAGAIAEAIPGDIALVSFARAGTPVGVVLRRLLVNAGRDATHYSVSIVLDKGIDAAALDYIRSRHEDRAVVFVDGWTGKGAIAAELASSLSRYRRERGACPPLRLAVLADLAGVAQFAGSRNDYLIPSALLGAVGAGLISRTLYSPALVPEGSMHACRYYAEWLQQDQSRSLADAMTADALAAGELAHADCDGTTVKDSGLTPPAQKLFDWLSVAEPSVDRRHVKPGICESTRAMMRRSPVALYLRDADSPDVAHLLTLAQREGTSVRVVPTLPVQAMTLIRGRQP